MPLTQQKAQDNQLIADENSVGQRIDNFLIKHLKGVPKSLIYKVLRKGAIRVNKKRAKPTYRLEKDDVIKLPILRTSAPREITIDKIAWLENQILYEDKGFLVVNKPSGIAVHG